MRRLHILAAAAAAAGLFLGILLPELGRAGGGSYAGLVSVYGLREFERKSLDVLSLFPYVAGVRLRTILFLWMSSYTPPGLFLHMAYLFWLCFLAGILLAVFVLRQGYGGIFLFLCCLLPQWLLYLSVFARELRFLWRKRQLSSGGDQAAVRTAGREDWKELAGMLLFMTAGALVEAGAGLKVFQIFLQYL